MTLLLDFSPATLGYLRARYLSSNATKAAELASTSSGAGDQAAGLLQGGSSPGPENLPPSGPDPACLDCEPRRPCATHRRGCENCGYTTEEGAELHAGTVSASKKGPGVSPIVELWCDKCDPPPPVGERYADSQQDPWDLSDEELAMTCPLPRGESRRSYRDRAEYDEHDDKSDIQPFERTTK